MSDPPTPRYSYWIADLFTGEVLADVPLRGVRFSRPLSGTGQLTGSTALGTAQAAASRVLDYSTPRKHGLFAVREAPGRERQVVWGGLLWNRDYDDTGGQLQLHAVGIDAHYRAQTVQQAPALPLTFTQVDQLEIARRLILEAHAGQGAAIRVRLGAETSGVLRDRTYPEDTLYPRTMDLIDALSRVIDGFDWTFEPRLDAQGDPEWLLRLEYPRRATPDATVTLQKPGNIAGYGWPEAGDGFATSVRVVSQLEDQRLLIGVYDDAGLLAAGFPRADAVYDRAGISRLDTANEWAASYGHISRMPVTTPVVRLKPYQDPDLSELREGDVARVVIRDHRFPEGLDVPARITQVDVTPPERGAAEQVQVALDLATAEDPR